MILKEYKELLKTIALKDLTGRVLTCKLCNQMYSALVVGFFDDNLQEQKNPSGTPLCSKCYIESRLRTESIKDLSFNELPLHLNEENIFALHLIKKRFNQENYMDESIEKQKEERDEEKEDTQRQKDTEVAITAALNAATIAGSIGCV